MGNLGPDAPYPNKGNKPKPRDPRAFLLDRPLIDEAQPLVYGPPPPKKQKSQKQYRPKSSKNSPPSEIGGWTKCLIVLAILAFIIGIFVLVSI